ncbi:transposase [Arthrobacter sp. Hiyo4]|nr:transposase [Arthrobacter sp. Hiyo4]
MTEWRRLRDAGVLAGKKAGESIGKLSAEQAENARLRRQLEVSESRLKKTEAALELMEKLQAFLESASQDMPDEPGPRNVDGHVQVDAGPEDPHAPGSILDGCFQDDREPETGSAAGPCVGGAAEQAQRR